MNTGEVIALAKAFGGGGSGGGGSGGVLVLDVDRQTMALNHTYKEIADAKFAVLPSPVNPGVDGYYILILSGYFPGSCGKVQVEFWNKNIGLMYFETDSETGYPVYKS